jgi:hypothetical protein
MTLFRYDYDLLTEDISSVASSCADFTSVNDAIRMMAERRGGHSQPMCFRSLLQPSALSVGVCPDRKQGPEEKSHPSLSIAVFPARNVA